MMFKISRYSSYSSCRLALKLIVTLTLILTFSINGLMIYLMTRKIFNNREHQNNLGNATETVVLEIISSRNVASVAVNGATVLFNADQRGISVLVLNRRTASVLAQEVFDTYLPNQDVELIKFTDALSENCVVIFTVRDEASFHLSTPVKDKIALMGSQMIKDLAWRDMWCFAKVLGQPTILIEQLNKAPDFSAWASPVRAKVKFTLDDRPSTSCLWPDTDLNKRRKKFCVKHEGFTGACNCSVRQLVPENVISPRFRNIKNIPVAVIASNRPYYLYKMLLSLLQADGVDLPMITVFIDGYFDSVVDVSELFGLRVIQHTPIGVKNARISQHYKASLTAAFSLYPDSQYLIILEEDLLVSPDFFGYFSQTLYLLEKDPSIYCISAWNDLGYKHTSRDVHLLYRIEGMPGLGWLLKRSLYKQELEPHWPSSEKQWDWDMWMRLPEIRKNRECIIPDVSRTFHFGSKGLNMNSYFHELYFNNHAFNSQKNVRIRNSSHLFKRGYEHLINELVSQAHLLTVQPPCDVNSLSFDASEYYVLYISSEPETWLYLAKCFKIWDLDVRGTHKNMWRLFIGRYHVFVIAVPASPYSKFMPASVTLFSVNLTQQPLTIK